MSNDNKASGHNLDTSEGARAYVAEFFANELRRHDFRAYITTRLAADFACALAKHLAARQPVELEPITVEAVAEIFNHPEYGLSINWLLENGIGELQVGDVLMVSDQAITDEDGSGEVYIAPPAPTADPYQRIPGLQGIGDAADYLARHPSDDYAQRRLCERIAEFCAKHGVNQPMKAVDLGKFRAQVAELLRSEFDLEVADPEDHRHDDGAGEAERIASRIAALIDSQAVGNG